jgi:ribosomal protein S18 acetylase RimI-like enzyme
VSERSADTAAAIDLFAHADAADEVIAVMHRAFAEYTAKGEMSGAMLETAETLRAELAAGVRIGMLRTGGCLAATVKHAPKDDGTLYFSRLAVEPESRGRGLAGDLVRALRAQAHTDGLSGLSCAVRADEAGNIAIYEHLGMQITRRETRVSRTGATLAVVVMADVAG